MGASFEESQNTEPDQIAIAVAEKVDQLVRGTQQGFSQAARSIENTKNNCEQLRNELKENIIAWIDSVGSKDAKILVELMS